MNKREAAAIQPAHKFIELSRAKVDELIIGLLRRRHRGALPISIEYDLNVEASMAICWYVPAKDGAQVHPKFAAKRIPQVRKGKPRRGPMRSLAYRQWCGLAPCAMAAVLARELLSPGDVECSLVRFRDAAHTANNGMRSKGPDSSCVPLCRAHHAEYDRGRAAFEKKYGVDMKAIARECYARYQELKGKA